MSGAVLRAACAAGDMFNVDRILVGASDFSKMRSPIYTGVQSDGWVQRKALLDIIDDRDAYGFGSIHVCVKNDRPEGSFTMLSSTSLFHINPP